MEKIKKFNKWLIAFTIIAQVLIDVLRKFGFANYEMFGVSLIEFVNIFLVGIIFVLTVITYENKRKLLKWIGVLILYLIYFVIHYYNTTQFNLSVYPEAKASLFTEFYYLFRIFVIPLVLIFSIYYSGIKKKELIQIMELFILVLCGSIVLLNVVKLSFLAYDTGFISDYSIFDWFTYSGERFQEMTTKGWFGSGNQISAILFMTLPIILYLAYSKKTKHNYFLLILQIIAMMMLGTKIANVGCMLILLAFVVIILFKKLIMRKEIKSIKVISLIILGSLVLFCFSPRGYELRGNKTENETGVFDQNMVISNGAGINEINCQNPHMSSDDKIFIEHFIYKNKNSLHFPDYFVDAYPPKYNYSFWCTAALQGIKFKNTQIDYREMKTQMLKQIYILNNNDMDKWVGMGQTINFLYTEEDYSYQFYYYGLIGLLLFIGPYFMILGYLIFRFIKTFRQSFTMENVLLILALFVGLVVPYMSGHVFERTFPIYILAFVAILNLVSYRDNLESDTKND